MKNETELNHELASIGKVVLADVIFVVTSGDYSDYKIDGIFTEKETAENFVKMFNSNYNEMRIEEHKLNPKKHEINNNYKSYFVRMKKDGTCDEIYINDSAYGVFEDTYNFDIHKNLYKRVFAKDGITAIKIVNDLRAQLIANNLWA